MSKQASYTLEAAIEHMQRITRMQGREWRITIAKHNPGGMTAHQTVEVKAIHAGFDWQAGQVVIEPAVPLVQLTPEELEQFRKSAAEGQSWHAYKITENYRKKAHDALAVLDWMAENDGAWCGTCDTPGLFFGPFEARKLIVAPTLREAIRIAMAGEGDTKESSNHD